MAPTYVLFIGSYYGCPINNSHNYQYGEVSYNNKYGALKSKGTNFMPITADFSKFSR